MTLQRCQPGLAATLALVLATILAGCGGSATISEESVAVAPTATTAVAPTATPAAASTESAGLNILDAAFLESILEREVVADGAILLVSIDADGTPSSASKGTDTAGSAPVVDDSFRIGSLTKIFTATLMMTLVEEGAVDLEAPASNYITRIPVPADVTVRQLLQHRTGIYNYTDSISFFPQVMSVTDKMWTPEEIAAPLEERASLFEPGSRFGYSNTNYLLLGVLIEEVTGQPYHQVLRDRILDPLDMAATHVAGFETGTEPFDPFTLTGEDEFDYTSVATSAWAAGGIVSTAPDLHTLLTALFDDAIVSDELVAEMTVGDIYGLGLQLDDWPRGIVGHGGGIPGYITIVQHAPETGVTVFAVTTQSRPGQGIGEQLSDALAAHDG